MSYLRKMIPVPLRLAPSILSMLAMSSCAAVFVRSESAAEPGQVFPATRFDAEFFWDGAIKGEPPLVTADPSLKNSPAERLAFGAGAIIDCPLSLATDVILLPADLLRLRRTKEKIKTKKEQP